MKRVFTWVVATAVLIGGSGCGDDGAGTGTGGHGGQGGEAGTPALAPLPSVPRYAVVSSDFTSSSIAVLDEDFAILDESWVSSGTTYPGLVATLSGDVVLPTRQAGDGTLAVIDRFFTDVVTRFFVPSGNLDGQVRTHGEVGEGGFSSNPQDLVFVDEESAWVPRYEPNLDPDARPENRGNDLFEIDPTDMIATGARIDLSSLDMRVAVEGDASEVEVFARPSRALLIGSRVVVGLDRISASFDVAGPGMVALVDLEDESVEGIEIAGLASCGNVHEVPGAPAKAVVACAGFSNPFGDEAQIRASAGIALLDVSGPEAQIEHVWRAADHPDAAVAVSGVVPIDERRVLGVASGDFETRVDAMYEIDLSTGVQRLVYESTGSFVIGRSAFDAERQILFVPDAAVSAVVELALDDGELVPLGSTEIAPSLGLPPTQVYLLE